MARIIYALSGQGRGHTSRVMAVSKALRRAGHEVVFCCGNPARAVLEEEEEPVLPVPALHQVIQDNRVRLGKTMLENWRTVLNAPRIVSYLADAFEKHHPDLLITDFEPFSARAAQRIGVPVLSFNHQQVITETSYDVPPRYWAQAAFTRAVIRAIAPSNPRHILLTSFFFPSLKDASRATLVPPILRPEVLQAAPQQGEHVLVYYNQTSGSDRVLNVLRQIDAPFILYNFDAPSNADRFPNLTFKPVSRRDFAEDLASSRAVLSTAGFTLISEALHLGKPMLVVPNQGVFEQVFSAIALQRSGRGRALLNGPLDRSALEDFLEEAPAYEKQLQQRASSGNEEAVSFIENLLFQDRPSAAMYNFV